jgi:hypothetical protein
MASTIKINDIVNQVRAFPGVVPVLGTAPSTEVAVSIANDTLQKMLAQSLPWKFNRGLVTPFLTIALQQDYIGILNNNLGGGAVTTLPLTDLAWLEQGWCIDINNTSTPKPVRSLETVRDNPQMWQQSVPFQVSWIPNTVAIYGTWQKNTSYPSGLGATQTPTSPIQQFIDVNGNLLYVSTNGTSGGSSAPSLPAGSAAGTTVSDNTVTWTVADPNGVAMRVNPLPATSGIVWEMHLIYQKKPPIKTKLTDTISPIPDEFAYMFRQGFLAMCLIYAGNKDGRMEYMRWEEALITALKSSDRERANETVYPSEGLISGGSYQWGQPVGPSQPYGVGW